MTADAVPPSADFDDKPMLQTDKIGDVSFMGRLTAKMKSGLFRERR
jgi:hypothetical protein